MGCATCDGQPKNTSKGFTKAVIEINNPEQLVLLRKVVIPASMGTEEDVPVAIGKYRNVVLQYEANNHIYLYSSDGIPTAIENNVPQEVLDRITELELDVGLLETSLAVETGARERADGALQQEINDLKNSPDVVDIVATYADLMAYDTSSLGDKDVIRVLTDETHEGQSDYYRWSTTTETWTFIGTVGNYYTKDQIDSLLNDKQDELTPGENISIVDESGGLVISAQDTTYTAGTNVQISSNNIISATDTTYTAGNGLNLTSGQFSVNTSTIATQTDLTNGLATKQNTLTAGNNISISGDTISATDTTYSAFTGTDGTSAGTSGLVPAPAATDAGKFLKADGTWGTAGGGSELTVLTSADYNYPTNNPTQVALWLLDTGWYTVTTDGVMMKVTNSLGNSTKNWIAYVGDSFYGSGTTAYKMIFYIDSGRAEIYSVRVEDGAPRTSVPNGTILTESEVINNLTSVSTTKVLSAAQGKALKDAIDSIAIKNAGAPTTATVGTVGQLLEDTTNGKLYICTAIVPGTDPDPDTYTWSEVGAGGGSGPTVVQTTGTSTTDVMSQNAVTSMVFADPATMEKIKIGSGASSSEGAESIEIGHNSSATGGESVAIGHGASSSGVYSVAIGSSSGTANGQNSVAIGRNASAEGTGNVSLGAWAKTNNAQQGIVQIGLNATLAPAHGYNNSQYRLLTGLYDPQTAHDAATKGYVDTAISGISVPDTFTTNEWNALWA